jgi:hypothetical protein
LHQKLSRVLMFGNKKLDAFRAGHLVVRKRDGGIVASQNCRDR